MKVLYSLRIPTIKLKLFLLCSSSAAELVVTSWSESNWSPAAPAWSGFDATGSLLPVHTSRNAYIGAREKKNVALYPAL